MVLHAGTSFEINSNDYDCKQSTWIDEERTGDELGKLDYLLRVHVEVVHDVTPDTMVVIRILRRDLRHLEPRLEVLKGGRSKHS